MKFNPLSVIKKKYTFELAQEQNMETEDIKAPDHLICWVEEENARIIEEESDGSVVVLKRNKKGDILYAQALEFPMDTDTDFDSLLDKFYTRKPIKFDQHILEETPVLNQSVPAPVIPQVAVPPVPQTQETASETYAEVPEIPSVNPAEATSPSTNQAIEIKELIAAQKAQQEEIEKLRQQREEERKGVKSVSPMMVDPELKSPKEPDQKSSEPKKQPNALSIGVPGEGRTITLSSLEAVSVDENMSFQDRINLFIEQKKEKIEAEIFSVDQRDLIETEVKAKIEKEKEAHVGRSEMELYEKQAAAIEKEEKRHTAEMERINEEYEQKIEHSIKKIEETYKRKAAAEIRSEYSRQTKELKQIFDQRMIDLKKQQSEFARKLTENIKATFSNLDLEIDEPIKESEPGKVPVLAELKTIRAGEK